MKISRDESTDLYHLTCTREELDLIDDMINYGYYSDFLGPKDSDKRFEIKTDIDLSKILIKYEERIDNAK